MKLQWRDVSNRRRSPRWSGRRLLRWGPMSVASAKRKATRQALVPSLLKWLCDNWHGTPEQNSCMSTWNTGSACAHWGCLEETSGPTWRKLQGKEALWNLGAKDLNPRTCENIEKNSQRKHTETRTRTEDSEQKETRICRPFWHRRMPRELTKPCRKQDGLGSLLPVPAAGNTTWHRGKSFSFVAEDVSSIDAAIAAHLWTLWHTRICQSCACLWRTFTEPWNITYKAQCRPPWKSLVTAWDIRLPVPLALRSSGTPWCTQKPDARNGRRKTAISQDSHRCPPPKIKLSKPCSISCLCNHAVAVAYHVACRHFGSGRHFAETLESSGILSPAVPPALRSCQAWRAIHQPLRSWHPGDRTQTSTVCFSKIEMCTWGQVMKEKQLILSSLLV